MRGISLILIIVIACLMTSCKNDSIKEQPFNEKIKLLNKNNSEDLTFKLENITDFEWDEFMIIYPYSDLNSIEKKVGLELNEIEGIGIDKRDDIVVLCFFRSNALVKYIEQPRIPYEFRLKDRYSILKKGEVNLIITAEQDYFLIHD